MQTLHRRTALLFWGEGGELPAGSSARRLTEPGEGLDPEDLDTRSILQLNFGIRD
ncbi:hypothetical protein SBA2_450138 [Acidobacteriia bacterium SbA2]|nr:hypothetical protein SBA2_450138 [Acidobacteriia bacterium SbA2]